MIVLTLNEKAKKIKPLSQKGIFSKAVPLSCNEPLVTLLNEPNVCVVIDNVEKDVTECDIYTLDDFARVDTLTLEKIATNNKIQTLDEKAIIRKIDYTSYDSSFIDEDEEDIDLGDIRELILDDILS